MNNFYYESVRQGHPDKLCDLIADSILDAFMAEDKKSRVACEVFMAGLTVVVGGEITSKGYTKVEDVVKSVLRSRGLNPESYEIINRVSRQSAEIDRLVSGGSLPKELGAGDQGVVVGYSCRGRSGLPLGYYFIQSLLRRIDNFFLDEGMSLGMGADGKGFISCVDGKIRVHVSYQASLDADIEKIEEIIRSIVNTSLMDAFGLSVDEVTLSFVTFNFGGSLADTGLTGRKLAVDTYGGEAENGGGALCGKDPTKVDRTGAYLARHIANTLVDRVGCISATVWLGYAIGESAPVTVRVRLEGVFGTPISVKKVREIELKVLEWVQKPENSLANLIERYCADVKFSAYSAYGHFGRKSPWEGIIEDLGV